MTHAAVNGDVNAEVREFSSGTLRLPCVSIACKVLGSVVEPSGYLA